MRVRTCEFYIHNMIVHIRIAAITVMVFLKYQETAGRPTHMFLLYVLLHVLFVNLMGLTSSLMTTATMFQYAYNCL